MEKHVEKHTAYPPNFKLKIVKVPKEKDKHFASKLFNVNWKCVREWCKSKMTLENIAKSQKRAPGVGRLLKYRDIEDRLINIHHQNRGVFIRRGVLIREYTVANLKWVTNNSVGRSPSKVAKFIVLSVLLQSLHKLYNVQAV